MLDLFWDLQLCRRDRLNISNFQIGRYHCNLQQNRFCASQGVLWQLWRLWIYRHRYRQLRSSWAHARARDGFFDSASPSPERLLETELGKRSALLELYALP